MNNLFIDQSMDPSTRFVRSLDGDYLMLRETAVTLGVSSQFLRKAIRDDRVEYLPSKSVWFGKVKIYLYTRQDLDRMRKALEESRIVFDHDGQMRRPGRPRRFTKDEAKERQRLFSRAYYYRKKIAQLEADNLQETGQYKKAQTRLREIERKLA